MTHTTASTDDSADDHADSVEFGEWMRDALVQLCVGGDGSDPDRTMTVDDVFAPEFTERTNGQELGRDDVLSNIARMRSEYASADIDIVRVLRVGTGYALQYRMHLRGADHSSSTIETHQFGEIDAKGRLLRIDEQVVPVDATAGSVPRTPPA